MTTTPTTDPTARDQLKALLAERFAGLIHNQDDGTHAAERFDETLVAQPGLLVELAVELGALEVWGSDCDGPECGGNATFSSQRCDSCNRTTHTVPMYRALRG